jgi:hypothetical protein
MLKVVRTSETSVYANETTRRNIPEGYFHTRRRENLKSHTNHSSVGSSYNTDRSLQVFCDNLWNIIEGPRVPIYVPKCQSDRSSPWSRFQAYLAAALFLKCLCAA